MSFIKNFFGSVKSSEMSSMDSSKCDIEACDTLEKATTLPNPTIENVVNGSYNVSLFETYMKNFNKIQHKNTFSNSLLSQVDPTKKQIRHQIVFIMDSTGSMQPYIDGTKDQIKTFINNLRSKVYEDFQSQFSEQEKNEFEFVYEVAVVAYRDFDDVVQFETLDFTTDINRVEEFLGKIHASGGNDTPEDVKGAFIHAFFGINSNTPRLSWDNHGQSASRTVMWLADAPPHGSKFNQNISGDNYRQDDNGWEFIVDEMSKLEVDLTLVKLCDGTNHANQAFRTLCNNKVRIDEVDVSQSVKKGFRENSGEAYKCVEESACTRTVMRTMNFAEKLKSNPSK